MKRNCRAFSLVEMLVVVLIIALLASLLIALVARSQRNARVAAVKADFQAIEIALEQYKADHREYPIRTHTAATPQWHRLAPAMLGCENNDGVSGPGFRARAGGKIWQPYLPTDKFAPKELAGQWELLDRFGQPIAYIPVRNRHEVGLKLFDDVVEDPVIYKAMFDKNDGGVPDANGNLLDNRIVAAAMGDTNENNFIDGSEQLKFDKPFILVSAGADGAWETDSGKIRENKTDDVFNFDW